MKAKKFVMVSMLVVLMGLVAGCHYGSDDDYRGYGYGSGSGNAMRDAFRAGRAYERRSGAWGSPYYDRYGSYRR